jgi:hypothetical protein
MSGLFWNGLMCSDQQCTRIVFIAEAVGFFGLPLIMCVLAPKRELLANAVACRHVCAPGATLRRLSGSPAPRVLQWAWGVLCRLRRRRALSLLAAG